MLVDSGKDGLVSSISSPLRLVTGDLPFAGHTITNLCRKVSARRPGDTCVIESREAARGLNEVPRHAPRLGPRDVLHIGNNPYAVPLVIAMQNGWRFPTVVLHDLWLFDLIESWGATIGKSHLALRVLSEGLGVRAGRQAIHFRSGQPTESEAVATMAACLIRATLPPDTRVIVHRDSAFVRHTLALAGLPDVHQATLPLHWAMSTARGPFRPARWDVAVSGTGSFTRRKPVIADALSLVSHARPIRVLLIGGMSQGSEACRLEAGSTLDVVQYADDGLWGELHAATRVGIRLGVGQLGEGSGLVRDYLTYGMGVVTDDDQPPVNRHPAVHLVASDASSELVATAILGALESPGIPAVNADPEGLDAYSASLHAALDHPRDVQMENAHE